MPHVVTKQFQVREFTAAEVLGFVVVARSKVDLDCCILVPGEGRVSDTTARRARVKMREAKAESIATLPTADQPSGLHLSLMIDKQMLDDWLRPQIPDLPEIGRYMVVQPPRNPDVSLRVRWEEATTTPTRRG